MLGGTLLVNNDFGGVKTLLLVHVSSRVVICQFFSLMFLSMPRCELAGAVNLFEVDKH